MPHVPLTEQSGLENRCYFPVYKQFMIFLLLTNNALVQGKRLVYTFYCKQKEKQSNTDPGEHYFI